MSRKAVEPQFKWINPDGTPTQYFSELIQSISERSLTMPVITTAPANGDVLTFSTTTNKWEPA
jgi:hypothetical protein